jgi:hypothetical protein
MFIRFLFLTAILLQISGCLATPRLFSKIDEDYEPPQEEQPKEQIIYSPEPRINNQLSNEIRQKF